MTTREHLEICTLVAFLLASLRLLLRMERVASTVSTITVPWGSYYCFGEYTSLRDWRGEIYAEGTEDVYRDRITYFI